jgi:hypothetical protein
VFELYRIAVEMRSQTLALLFGPLAPFYTATWHVAMRVTSQAVDVATRFLAVTPGLPADELPPYPDSRPIAPHPLDAEYFALLSAMDGAE